MKNLLWILIGCVVAIALIVVIILLSAKKSESRKQYKECWSDEMVWSDVESLSIVSNTCNEESVIELDLSKYPKLKSVTIGDECFMYVNEVKMIGMSELESVEIGMNCFTKHKNSAGSDSNRHFYLKNCPKLKSLEIGHHSFSDYRVCEIETVNALEVIEIGDLNEDSPNFVYASLELKSILIHSEYQLDMPSLKSLTFGGRAFQRCSRIVFESDSFSFHSSTRLA